MSRNGSAGWITGMAVSGAARSSNSARMSEAKAGRAVMRCAQPETRALYVARKRRASPGSSLRPLRGLRGEHAPDRRDELALRHRELRRAALAPFPVVRDLGGEPRALHEVLDLHLAAGALVAALDDDAGAVAPVGILHLRLHAGAAEIHLGPDAGSAQRRHHPLVAAERLGVPVHDQHDDRAGDVRV